MKFLIVDDALMARSNMTKILEALGHESIDHAVDGEQAIKQLTEFRRANYYDIVFLDINMPKMNGIDVLKNIKNHPSIEHTKIIVITAERDPKLVTEALKNGATGFVSKPVQEDDIKKITEKVAENLKMTKPQ